MVYGSEAPAKLPKVKTEAEKALSAVNSLESLEIIGKLLYNAAVQPKEEKFRKIKLSNGKIKQTITDVPEALNLLLTWGWERETSDGEEFLTIPAGKYMSMKDVRAVEDQKNEARKQAHKETVAALRVKS
ncbi:hypothetical protein DUNSADRAFT_15161 [Dunaliella salina]|uniref:PUB domain-containing protein n=1 Tax=Dunaliella salina TaxID=3046 RepID=A0ABQ7G5Z9_DUNSA|nr:hypothetical protein DUNSADRAFT_15161 [Dunaliella salina]|eukprot:KAF5830035.1 hypothetical protein DUNSADRAFT_15161 [Dunaliella salina]